MRQASELGDGNIVVFAVTGDYQWVTSYLLPDYQWTSYVYPITSGGRLMWLTLRADGDRRLQLS